MNADLKNFALACPASATRRPLALGQLEIQHEGGHRAEQRVVVAHAAGDGDGDRGQARCLGLEHDVAGVRRRRVRFAIVRL